MQKSIAGVLLLQTALLTSSPAPTHAQRAGTLLDIDYPVRLKHSEPLEVIMTVENTGAGAWSNLCAFVGYRSYGDGNPAVTVTTCPMLGNLDPGAVGIFTCTLESGISGIVEKIWAGVGAPLG